MARISNLKPIAVSLFGMLERDYVDTFGLVLLETLYTG